MANSIHGVKSAQQPNSTPIEEQELLTPVMKVEDKTLTNPFPDGMSSLETPPLEINQEEIATPSFWSRIKQAFPWFFQSQIEPRIAMNQEAENLSVQANRVAKSSNESKVSISPIPVIEDTDPLDEERARKIIEKIKEETKASAKGQERVKVEKQVQPHGQFPSKEELLKEISAIQDETNLLFQSIARVLETNKEKGIYSEAELTQLLKMKKAFNGTLNKLKVDVEKDQNAVKYLGFSQAIASAIMLLGSALSLVPQVGPVASSVVQAIGGVVNGLGTTFRLYFDTKSREKMRDIDDLQFHQKNIGKRSSRSFKDVSSTMDFSTQTHSLLIRLIKLYDQTKSSVIKAN